MPSTNSLIVQRPPNRQNYAIGCQGIVSGNGPFNHPRGYIEDSGSQPMINSLYETQLSNRLENGPTVDAPARFLVENIADEVQISWLDIADDEAGYIIEISNDGMTFDELVDLAADEKAYSFPTAQLSSETVYFRMYAYSASTCPSAYTHTAFLDFAVATENLELTSVEILPNPASDFLEFKVHHAVVSDIQVFTVDGRYVPSRFANHELNLSNFNPGVYYIRIGMSNGEMIMKKFVKI
jgi:hypothetical protein